MMEFIKDILRGVLIGIANAVPGVSGGTMMVSMGIYDKVLSAFTGVIHTFKKSVKVLFPYIIGMIVGIIGLSFAIEYLFEEFPLQTAMLFIGLILGGIPVLFAKVKDKRVGFNEIVVFILFFFLIIGLQMLSGSVGKDVTLVLSGVMAVRLFFIGVIAAATMVIPGVSGSMILMLLGFYRPIIECVTTIIKALSGGDFQTVMTQCCIMVPFGLGVVLGIFVISKLIEMLLIKKETMSYSAILGLVVASPVVILMQLTISEPEVLTFIASFITLIIGFTVAFFLGRE